MKRRWMIAGILAAVMVLFSGCMINPAQLFDKDKEQDGVSKETSVIDDVSESDEDDDDDGDSIFAGKFDTVKAYLDSEEAQEEIKDAMASLQGMDIKVTATADTLTYTYTYQDDMDKSVVGPLLDEQMEKQGSTFSTIAKQLKLVVDQDPIYVEVVYLNVDGSVLSEHRYSSDD